MKSLFIAACLIAVNLSAFSQNPVSANNSLPQLLSYYYNLKNALVKDDAQAASVSAAQLLSTATGINLQMLNASGQKAFSSVKEAIIHNAGHISKVTDLDHQREHFAKLSEAMSTLVQKVSLSGQPVYIAYCPMKKARWLSGEKVIQNPYYGKEMLGCGNVTKTIMRSDEQSLQMTEIQKKKDSMVITDTVTEHNMNGMHDMDDMQMNMTMDNMSHAFSLHLPMSRNGSGTAWMPDVALMYGNMYHSKNWMYMLHYNLFLRYTNQDFSNKGSRGADKFDAPNWLMFMGQRKVGANGLFHFNTMFSADAAVMGGGGYPLLFQSGEAYKGSPIVDRQHPHDLISELSVSYAQAISKKADLFVYLAYPGEPAIGPVAFMHRPSALYNPDAPLSHHWIDATHITFGVATFGARWGNFKIEGSSFTGREPDEDRYNFDKPRFDSWSGRLSYNPSQNWALQVSHGFIKNPEELHINENVNRTTASATYSLPLTKNGWLNAIGVWGQNKTKGHDSENAFLLEGSWRKNKLAIYLRYEYVQKSIEELNLDDTTYGDDAVFPVNAFTLGFNYDVLDIGKAKFAMGSQFTFYNADNRLNTLYGKNPMAFEVYLRFYPALMKM